MIERASVERERAERREAFSSARKWVWLFLVCNAVALGSVVLVALLAGPPSAFMWVRAVILVAASPFLLWMARRAGESSVSAVARLRTVSTVLPIAVIVIDFIPGVAPVWYGVTQGIGALALVPVAVIAWRWTRRSAPREGRGTMEGTDGDPGGWH